MISKHNRVALAAALFLAPVAIAVEIPMINAHRGHTATLLRDGTVLIAGGFNRISICACAEVYDPANGSFHAVGPLTVPRIGHTTTLLNDGTVLIAGGNTTVAAAEIYEPQTQRFTSTGGITPRLGGAAARQLDGRVLIVGGWSPAAGLLSSAEIFDPLSRSFSQTGSLNVARELATATTLQDGRVLITGGNGSSDYGVARALSSSEIYDPRSGTFSPAPSTSAIHPQHTATLLGDGTVLVVGGSPTAFSASAEIFNPSQGVWSYVGAPLSARNNHAAVALPDGDAFIIGGRTSDISADVVLFSAATRTFALAGALDRPRVSATATLLSNGSVLVAGGSDMSGDLSSAQIIAFHRRRGARSAALPQTGPEIVRGALSYRKKLINGLAGDEQDFAFRAFGDIDDSVGNIADDRDRIRKRDSIDVANPVDRSGYKRRDQVTAYQHRVSARKRVDAGGSNRHRKCVNRGDRA